MVGRGRSGAGSERATLRPLTLPQARRLALAAQGFAEPRPSGRIDRRHLRRVLARTQVIQIDSVNVVARSQDLVLFSRLGAHPADLLPAAADDGELFEYWVHEACHVPVDQHHLYRWRMALDHRWGGVRAVALRRPDLVAELRHRLATDGPLTAGDVSQRSRPKGPWWDWDDAKAVLEALFHSGEVTARRRRRDFARLYGLTEQMLPASVLARPTPTEAEARAELLVRAARAYGVATEDDLADFHRQRLTDVRPLLAELVAEGRLERVRVEGWERPTYLDPEARMPRRVDARALLSPFDPVVWYRPRALRLFGFHYRIEIYTPAARRRYGYYVLPFLLGDRLVGRADLKADRVGGRLVVRAAWIEPGVDPAVVAPALVAELREMAGWLGLAEVVTEARGDLALPLRCADDGGNPARSSPT